MIVTNFKIFVGNLLNGVVKRLDGIEKNRIARSVFLLDIRMVSKNVHKISFLYDHSTPISNP